MRYPCSYMIYTVAFEGLPPEGREAIYKRMWQALSGQEKDPKYAVLSRDDRQAVVEILRDTKKGLPGFLKPPAQKPSTAGVNRPKNSSEKWPYAVRRAIPTRQSIG